MIYFLPSKMEFAWKIKSQKYFRYPNPKTNHRFGPSDWYDFFENDFDYEDDESRKKKKKSKKKKIPPSTYKSESGTSGSQTEAVAVRSKHQKEEIWEKQGQSKWCLIDTSSFDTR